MTEVWKTVKGFEDYEVSNLGRVKSLERTAIRTNGRRYFVKERILKHGRTGSGYDFVGLRKNLKSKNRMIHQLVAIAFLYHTPCGHKLVVNHIDGNRMNNRVENLEIVTQRENCHTHHKGTSKYKGVYWYKHKEKWMSRIHVNGKREYLGIFTSELEAHNAYQNRLKQIL